MFLYERVRVFAFVHFYDVYTFIAFISLKDIGITQILKSTFLGKLNSLWQSVSCIYLEKITCLLFMVPTSFHFIFFSKETWSFLKINLFVLIQRINYSIQYHDGFCHRSTWIIHGYTFAPASPTILNPPPTSLPTLALWVVPEHQIWVPCFMHEFINITYFTYVMYTMLFSKPSHPCSLPPSTKVSSLHLCLLCCSVCRINGAVLLYSLYVCWYTVFVFLFWLIHSV